MATITLSTAAYDSARKYAESQNLSVDEFIVSLINKFVPAKKEPKKQYRMKPIEELAPELQAIIGFAKPNNPVDDDDLNGDKARMEYYAEKYGHSRPYTRSLSCTI